VNLNRHTAQPDPGITLTVCDVIPATPRARLVRLCGHTFAYRSGQAALVGCVGSPLRRFYSIACAPEDAAMNGCIELLVGVDGSGSAGPHLPLEIGELVQLHQPGGSFVCPCPEAAAPFIFVAGGTGIAPLRAILRHSVHTHGGQFVLIYSARSPEEFAFQSEFERAGQLKMIQTITRTGGDQWGGARGRLRSADFAAFASDCRATWFVCGPVSFVISVVDMLGDLGVPLARLRFEHSIQLQRGSRSLAP